MQTGPETRSLTVETLPVVGRYPLVSLLSVDRNFTVCIFALPIRGDGRHWRWS